ncbi:MAG: YceI family protein [Bacteroidetes bacterium]|nr:MAG: YceI family protein [Bacteroidota bacterium]
MLKKTIFLTCMAIGMNIISIAQDKFMTRTGHVEFFSHTPMEDIHAKSNQLTVLMDKSTGNIVCKVLIKSFEFEKALMQEHFNENYMESDKFPQSVFKGQITNISEINFEKDGTYPATVEGELTIKETTNKIKVTGSIIITNGKPVIDAEFHISLKDYNVKNDKPKSISDDIKITVKAELEPYKK